MNQEDFQKIKEEIRVFFGKLGFEAEIEVKPLRDTTIPIELKTEEPQILIGERGQVLAETQRLLKIILKRKTGQFFYIDLDINDYKKNKLKYLKELAKSTADEVVLLKREKYLPPMPAYERRIIHLELAARNDVVTESFGQEPERAVVVKPYP